MFECTSLILISDVDQDKQMFGSHKIFLTYRCIVSYYIQNGDIKCWFSPPWKPQMFLVFIHHVASGIMPYKLHFAGGQ